MQYQPVMSILFEPIRREFDEPVLHLSHRFPGRILCSVGYPEDVCIHGDGGFSDDEMDTLEDLLSEIEAMPAGERADQT